MTMNLMVIIFSSSETLACSFLPVPIYYRFNHSTGLLGMSYAQFRPSEVSPLTLGILKLASTFGVITMETEVGEDKDMIRINNLTVINFVIKCVGPCHEQTLTIYMMAIQVRSLYIFFMGFIIVLHNSLHSDCQLIRVFSLFFRLWVRL